MSTRPRDWSPLAGADPVPGDPEAVAAMARHYAGTAREIAQQVSRLQRIADLPDWEGKAAERFAESAGDLADELGKAHRRFDELAGAVQSWVEPLTRAQEDSLAVLREAKEAEAAAASTAGSLLTGVAEPTPDQQDAQDLRERDHADALGALDAAKRRLREVLEDLDDAADRAADAIGDAADHWSDSRWDRFKAWVADHAGVLKAVAEVAAWVATGLAVLALLITSPVWATVVGVVAVVAGIVALAAHLALAAAGEGSWTDVAIDVFALATFGIGRVAVRGVRAAVAVTRSSAITAVRTPAVAARLAQSGRTLGLASWAVRTRLPLGPLRRVGMDALHGVARAANQAGDDAVARMAGLTAPRVSGLQALRTFDRELAENLAQAAQLSVHAPVEAAAAITRARRLAGVLLAGAGLDALDKLNTVGTWVGLPDLKPDLRGEIPSVDLPDLTPSVVLSGSALPGPR